MAIKSGLFNSVNGDQKYKADFFTEYFAIFISNGVFPNPSTGLQVIAGTGMTVNVKAGKAWINGYYFANDADYSLQLDVADGVLKRIDRIGLRLDFLSREIVPVIIKGTFASNPVAPALQRDADAYELSLADVFINNVAISITQGNITDQRLNTVLCGIVHGTVNQVDTTTIFNQYLSWFNQYSADKAAQFNTWTQEQQALFSVWKASEEQDFDTWSEQQRSDFDAWFATIQDILSGDVAGNLQAQITALDGRLDTLEDTVATHNADDIKHITDQERTNWNAKETPSGALKKVEQTSFKAVKSNKDTESIFTTIEYRRKSDNTLAALSVLSGGTSPNYTTRTVTYYAPNGTTVEKTDTFTLSYDADGDLISEV
ncbi:hypothetical protein JNUCC23_08890 [Peribacillus sp. JNUCC 23]